MQPHTPFLISMVRGACRWQQLGPSVEDELLHSIASNTDVWMHAFIGDARVDQGAGRGAVTMRNVWQNVFPFEPHEHVEPEPMPLALSGEASIAFEQICGVDPLRVKKHWSSQLAPPPFTPPPFTRDVSDELALHQDHVIARVNDGRRVRLTGKLYISVALHHAVSRSLSTATGNCTAVEAADLPVELIREVGREVVREAVATLSNFGELELVVPKEELADLWCDTPAIRLAVGIRRAFARRDALCRLRTEWRIWSTDLYRNVESFLASSEEVRGLRDALIASSVRPEHRDVHVSLYDLLEPDPTRLPPGVREHVFLHRAFARASGLRGSLVPGHRGGAIVQRVLPSRSGLFAVAAESLSSRLE